MSEPQDPGPDQPAAPAYPGQPPTYPASPAPQYPDPQYAQQYPDPQYGQQYGQQYAYPYAGQPVPDKRPGTVTAAAVITWISAGLTVAFGIIMIIVGVIDDDQIYADVSEDADIARDTLRTVLIAFGIGTVVWSAVAIVLAVLAFRRSNGGRIALVVSAALSGLTSLLLILAVFPVLYLALTITVIVCLFTGGANDWYRRPAAPQAQVGAPPPPAPYVY